MLIIHKRSKTMTLCAMWLDPHPFSSPEPTILVACGRNRELWEQPFQACAIDEGCVKPDGQNSVISFVISKWLLPELSIPAAGQKDRRLWGRECGLASTSRMRTAISPGQWQPWTVVSALFGLINMTDRRRTKSPMHSIFTAEAVKSARGFLSKFTISTPITFIWDSPAFQVLGFWSVKWYFWPVQLGHALDGAPTCFINGCKIVGNEIKKCWKICCGPAKKLHFITEVEQKHLQCYTQGLW